MQPANDISEELLSLAPALIPGLGIQVYKVPENYFEEFSLSFYPNKILNPKPALQVPDGYFDDFAESLMKKIRSAENSGLPVEEQMEFSTTLNSIGKAMPYRMPEGYLDQFTEAMVEKVSIAKVIKMPVLKRSVFRYAAAAVVTGLLGLGIFNGMNNKAPNEEEVSRKVIFADARKILSTDSFEQTLESIPADDIVNYLENLGQDVDAAVVAVAASQPDLPEPVDYLLDDKALENFLKDLSPQTLN